MEWHPLARTDLAELIAYKANDSSSAAYRLLNDIQKQISALTVYPEIGRPGRAHCTRELVISRTPYIAIYRVVGDVVTVLRLLHGARRWPGDCE